jgi:RNA polymerase sigma-70 factor (ECF subfamily)
MSLSVRTNPTQWLEEHGDAMFRYASLRLRDRAAAEDAVQEALLSALKALDTYEGRSTERTWLIGILRHKVLDTIKSQSRTRSASETNLDAATPLVRGAARHDCWPKGIDGSENSELMTIIREELALLGSPAREALVLRIVEKLDSQTVCDILDLTPTNLWTIVHRGRLKLRDRVSDRIRDRDSMTGGSARP